MIIRNFTQHDHLTKCLGMSGSYDIKIRILVSGETGVGKTCLLHQLCHREFRIPAFTLGVDLKFHNILFKNRKIKLQIIDTAGNHRFKDIIKYVIHYFSWPFTNHSLMLCCFVQTRGRRVKSYHTFPISVAYTSQYIHVSRLTPPSQRLLQGYSCRVDSV
eukprot:sb/3472921/